MTTLSSHRPIFGINCTQCRDLLIAPEWSEYGRAALPPSLVLHKLRLSVRNHGIFACRRVYE